MELFDYMLELSQKGYFCSQILMKLALEADGADCPELVRALTAFNGGMGFTGGVCGALTGGCAVLGYYGGKGEDDELEAPELKNAVAEYVGWFKDYAAQHGGCDCAAILNGDPSRKLTLCPQIVADCNDKLCELIEAHSLL